MVFGEGRGIRLYRFLIIAFSSALKKKHIRVTKVNFRQHYLVNGRNNDSHVFKLKQNVRMKTRKQEKRNKEKKERKELKKEEVS